jgi:hypothetical protein
MYVTVMMQCTFVNVLRYSCITLTNSPAVGNSAWIAYWRQVRPGGPRGDPF